MQSRNMVSSLKSGWWKLALLVALMALPACQSRLQVRESGSLVCGPPTGGVSIAMPADAVVFHNNGLINVETDDETYRYYHRMGDICAAVDTETYINIITPEAVPGMGL